MLNHILLGPNRHEKKKYIEGLVADNKKHSKVSTELLIYYLVDDDVTSIIRSMTTPSLFVEATIIVLFQSELIKGPNYKALLEAIQNVDQNVSLIFVSDEYRLAESLNRLLAAAQKKIFYHPRQNSREKGIDSIFKEHFIEVDQEVLDYITELAQDGLLKQEEIALHLCYFYSEKGIHSAQSIATEGDDSPTPVHDHRQQVYLSLSQVIACISHLHTDTIFNFTQYIIEKKFDRCYALLSDQYNMAIQPILIIAGLRYQIQVALQLALHREGKTLGSQDELFTKFKIIGDKARNRYTQFSRLFSEKALSEVLLLCKQIDLYLRETTDSELIKTHLMMIVYVLQRELSHKDSSQAQRCDGSYAQQFLNAYDRDYNSSRNNFFSW